MLSLLPSLLLGLSLFHTPSVNALGTSCSAALGAGTAAASDPYWYDSISHLGGSAYAASGYVVYRNVMDYGAKGDGTTDDTAAINSAISEGGRCGLGCSSSTVTPAVVYFPTGNYLISSPIIPYYYTTLLGDAKNPPTLTMSAAFSNSGTGYDAAIEADPYIPGGNGANYWTNQNNFFRSVRNFIIDTTAVPVGTQAIGIHWQVAQATSLQDITVKMSAASGTKHIGIYMENGSGGFMSDVTTTGGINGLQLGNQQFTFRSISVSNAVNGIYGTWNWGMTFINTTIDSCTNGFYLTTGGNSSAPTDGANYILDTVVTNTPTFILTSTNQATEFAGSLVIDNAVLTGVTNGVMTAGGPVALAGSSNIDLWFQGSIYTPTGTRTYAQQTGASYSKPAGLLDSNGNVFGKSRPQYEAYAASQFQSVKASGAKGDGVTDDTAAIQAVLAAYAGCKIIYFDAGTYLVTDTIVIPEGTTVVGEFFPVILASGLAFASEATPKVVVQVGSSGESGTVEISNMLFSAVGGSSGAIMMEWNVAATAAGDAGLWDSHFRLGGAVGTNIEVAKCSNTSSATDGSCNTAYLGLHVTAGSSGMFENVWVWAADHDLDDQAQGQINSFSARGVLVESTAPTWFIGTASEHHTLYQYNFNGAENIFIGLAQTETPYYQPLPAVPAPFTASLASDPTYPSGLQSAWAFYVQNSKDILVGGAGFYSFYSAYNQACITPLTCQTQIVNIDTKSTGIRFYNLNTVGTTKQLSVGESGIITGSDNSEGFQQTTTFWSTDAAASSKHRSRRHSSRQNRRARA